MGLRLDEKHSSLNWWSLKIVAIQYESNPLGLIFYLYHTAPRFSFYLLHPLLQIVLTVKAPQQFQMNRYISHWFLKWLFWYIINLYGKLHLLVWKFLQKGHWKGPKKGLKNVDCANWENVPIFSKWIDRLCASQYSKIYRFIWRRMCVITHSFLKSVRFWRI